MTAEKPKKKNKDANALPYRPCVGAALFNAKGQVWVGRRIPRSDESVRNFWQMPQGGIDKGEDPREAVVRELLEETGTDRVEFLAETSDWLTYDLPDHLRGVSWGGKYRGQKQKWFALRYLGIDGDFNLDHHGKPEFSEWRWVALLELPDIIVPFKRDVYSMIVNEFSHIPERITRSS